MEPGPRVESTNPGAVARDADRRTLPEILEDLQKAYDERGERIKTLKGEIADRDHWKREALVQLGLYGNAFQKVGELLNLPVGSCVSKALVPAVEAILRDRDSLRGRVPQLSSDLTGARHRITELEDRLQELEHLAKLRRHLKDFRDVTKDIQTLVSDFLTPPKR